MHRAPVGTRKICCSYFAYERNIIYIDVGMRYFKSCYFSHVFRVRYIHDPSKGRAKHFKSRYFSHAFRVRNAHDLMRGWVSYFKPCYFSHVLRVCNAHGLLIGKANYSKSCYSCMLHMKIGMILRFFQEQDSQRKTKIFHFYLALHLDGDFAPHTLDSAHRCSWFISFTAWPAAMRDG